jgi:hypothetical protein
MIKSTSKSGVVPIPFARTTASPAGDRWSGRAKSFTALPQKKLRNGFFAATGQLSFGASERAHDGKRPNGGRTNAATSDSDLAESPAAKIACLSPDQGGNRQCEADAKRRRPTYCISLGTAEHAKRASAPVGVAQTVSINESVRAVVKGWVPPAR